MLEDTRNEEELEELEEVEETESTELVQADPVIDVEIRNMISGAITPGVRVPEGSTIQSLIDNDVIQCSDNATFTDLTGRILNRSTVLSSGDVIEVSKAIEGGIITINVKSVHTSVVVNVNC